MQKEAQNLQGLYYTVLSSAIKKKTKTNQRTVVQYSFLPVPRTSPVPQI